MSILFGGFLNSGANLHIVRQLVDPKNNNLMLERGIQILTVLLNMRAYSTFRRCGQPVRESAQQVPFVSNPNSEIETRDTTDWMARNHLSHYFDCLLTVKHLHRADTEYNNNNNNNYNDNNKR